MPEELKPQSAATIDVSPEAAVGRKFSPKICKTCGIDFLPSVGFQLHCKTCGGQRERTKRTRKNAKAKEARDFEKPNCATEIKKKAAIEILQEQRLIRNTRVAEVCWELAVVAARNLKLPLNAHLFIFGVQKTLEAIQAKKEVTPPEINDVWEPGERIRQHELWAIWDYSTSWR